MFKSRDKVWVYFNPKGLEAHCELPIFECEVEGIFLNTSSMYGGEEIRELQYLVSMGTFDESSHKQEKYVFSTREEAAIFAITELKEKIEALEDSKKRYELMLNLLESKPPR